MSRFLVGEKVRVAGPAGRWCDCKVGTIVEVAPSRSGHPSMDQYTISDDDGELRTFADFQLERSQGVVEEYES
jgi:hypothetical protein